MDGGSRGRERLSLLSEVMGPSTRALLAEVKIPVAASCLDLGCGGGDVSFDLGGLAGPTGHVLGVDIDGAQLDIARCEAAQRGLSNVEFEVSDVSVWKPHKTFDVIYARFLLTHLAHPAGLLATMRQALGAGGALIVEDIDFRGHFAEPACPALARFVELYPASVFARGGDPNIGPRLPALLRDAGLVDVQMRLIQPAALVAGIKRLTCVTLERIAATVLADGLATEAQLRATLADLEAFAADPHTVLGGPRVFQVWGRCPGPA